MDRRSWPWKKKSSDKAATEKVLAASESVAAPSALSGSHVDQVKQDNYKKPTYVQISVESYTRLTGLEDQVKSFEDQISSFEDQVKTLEDEVKELNDKLSAADAEMITKENLVKQHAKVAEEAVSGWEKAESEASALKNHLESVTLLKLTAEDRASHLDGALKECTRQIRNLKEEHEQKLQEVIRTKTRQCDQIKFELESKISNFEQELYRSNAENAALSRSLQDRSNMLIKTTEQKSQAEAEIEMLKSNIDACDREINSLKYELHIINKELEIRNEEKNMSVRSAEVANKQQMEGAKKIVKLENELHRLRGLVKKKLPGPAAMAQMKIEVENMGRDYGETRFKRSPVKPPTSPQYMSIVPEFSVDNSQNYQKENELLTERLLAMEEETKMLKEALAKRNSELQVSRSVCAKTVSRLRGLEKTSVAVPTEGYFSQHTSQPPSMTSMSEDGNDDEISCAGSWATGSISELSHFKKQNNISSPDKKDENVTKIELMDDFLEMEKLAYLSNDSSQSLNQDSVEIKEQNKADPMDAESSPLINLQSRISMVFKSISKETEMKKVLDEISRILQDNNSDLEEPRVSDADVSAEIVHNTISQELADAIYQINEFVLLLRKEAKVSEHSSPNEDEFVKKLELFSVSYNDVINRKSSLCDFIICLSSIVSKASELRFNLLGCKNSEVESNDPDCIDKIALPENKVIQDGYQNGSLHFSDSTSDPEVLHEEFEQLKMEKDKMGVDLETCNQNLEHTKLQLTETEQLLADVKSELLSAQKMNGLADTQLKCMAESYKSLESRSEELQKQVNVLQANIDNLGNELEAERKIHQDALTKCKDLQEQIERFESRPVAEFDSKTNQERELADAEAKLAECQETIYILGKQIKNMRPQMEPFMGSPFSDGFHEDDPTISGNNNPIESGFAGSGSPIDLYNAPPFSPDSEPNSSIRSPLSSKKHRSTKSSSSAPTPEKHSRGFSRFFFVQRKNRSLDYMVIRGGKIGIKSCACKYNGVELEVRIAVEAILFRVVTFCMKYM